MGRVVKSLYEPVDPADARDPTDAEVLYREAMAMPARLEIERVLQVVEDLGLNRQDPRIIKRAMRAGSLLLLREASAAVLHRSHLDDPGPNDHDPVVYYMRLGTLVKIGTTKAIGNRAANINPEEILAVELGDVRLEGQRHQQFAALRNHGEWFRYEDPIRRHVAEVRRVWERRTGAPVEDWLRPRVARRRRAANDLPG